MRLWHKELIQYLPRQQLLGQWRECCAIARNISTKGTPNHVLVNKVLEYKDEDFNTYTYKVVQEMIERGYDPDITRFFKHRKIGIVDFYPKQEIFKDWHNDRYMKQCLMNLQEKADCGAIPAEEWKKITDIWPEMK